jgi:hypothetical protein
METPPFVLLATGMTFVIVHVSMALLLLRDLSERGFRRRLRGGGLQAEEERGRLSCLGYLSCALGLLGLGFASGALLAGTKPSGLTCR